MKGLERYLPRAVIEDIVNPNPAQQAEHDKYVSFDTQVQCIADFWNEGYKKYEKVILDEKPTKKEA
jgi:hypothetical protein